MKYIIYICSLWLTVFLACPKLVKELDKAQSVNQYLCNNINKAE